MKYIVTFIWSFLIAQVTFYIGSQLTQNDYNFIHATILAVAVTICVGILLILLPPVEKAPKNDTHA